MRRITRIVVATVMITLSATVPVAADPPPNLPGEALDTDHTYHHVGTLAEIEAIHRKRLLTGPTGDDLYKLAEDRKYVVETPASKVLAAVNAPQAGIDPVSFDECEQHSPPDQPYWFKNKYNSCLGSTITVEYFDPESPSFPIGTTEFQAAFIGVAQDGSNTIDFGIRLRFLRSDGETDPAHTTLSLKLGCVNADPARQSTCAISPAEVTRTVAEWQSDGLAQPASFTSTATTTNVPADMYAAEMRGYFRFDVLATIVGVGGDAHSAMMAPEYFRCDVARDVIGSQYVVGSHCVFTHVLSSLSLNANDPNYGESATFIRDAHVDVTRTKPGVAGKNVPGSLDEQPLHRLFNAYDTENDINGSRRKVRRTCRKYFGVDYAKPPGEAPRHCDEYPFATTYENSARVDESSRYTFAVRAVTATHNEMAGTIYGTWLRVDHLLDGDPFYIIIR